MFQLTPLGTIQKDPTSLIQFSNNTIGAAAQIVYTVPAGKKAKIVSIKTQSVGFGNGTKLDYRITGTVGLLIREDTVAQTTPQDNANITNVVLVAGQTITVNSDAAGNNASSNIYLNVIELPA